MAKDANGVDKIYPTRVGGAEFISDANLASNDQFVIDGNMVSDGGGVFHMTDYSQCRNTANPKPNYPQEAIGGTNNNQGDNVTRGYAMTKDDWLNFEMTQYIQVSSWSPSDSEIIMKGPTGTHHGPGNGSPDDCSGSSYGIRTGMENPTNSEFFKEQWHVHYESDNYVNLPSMGNFKDGLWHGIKYMNYEVIVNGKKCRKLEHWLDKDGDGSGFVKVNEMIDQGGWGDQAKQCHAPNADQIMTWANGRAMWRYDATSTNLKFKWLACREIDINGNPDQGGGGTGGGGTGGSIMQDGVKAIYPTKSGGWEWYMDNSKPFDGHLEKGGGSDYGTVVKDNDGGWRPDSTGTIKFNIETDPSYKDGIGVCNMNYHDCIMRGYSYKTNWDLDHVEMTAFYRIASGSLGNDGLYMRGPCNHHPGSPCCQEYDYDVRVKTGSGGYIVHTKDHPDAANNFDEPGVGHRPLSFTPASDLYFGVKYVHIIVDNTMENARVRLECYLNRNGDKVTWEKVSTCEDFIGKKWGTNSNVCGGEPYQVLAWRSPRMVIKWYDANVHFKLWSIRQIDPDGTFENPPPDPDPCPSGQHRDINGDCVPDDVGGGGGGGSQPPGEPTKLSGRFSLRRDINILRTSPCSGSTGGGGGGGSSGTPFYNVTPDGTSGGQALDNTRKGIYEFVAKSSSIIIGKLPVGIDLYLKRVGSPTGTATAVHRTAAATDGGTDDTIKQTFGTINVATIATTETLYSFGPITNTTKKIIFRNKIGLEYSGGDSSNYIEVSRNKPGFFDGQNTYKLTKEGTAYVQARDYDLCGKFYEL